MARRPDYPIPLEDPPPGRPPREESPVALLVVLGVVGLLGGVLVALLSALLAWLVVVSSGVAACAYIVGRLAGERANEDLFRWTESVCPHARVSGIVAGCFALGVIAPPAQQADQEALGAAHGTLPKAILPDHAPQWREAHQPCHNGFHAQRP